MDHQSLVPLNATAMVAIIDSKVFSELVDPVEKMVGYHLTLFPYETSITLPEGTTLRVLKSEDEQTVLVNGISTADIILNDLSFTDILKGA